MTRNLPAKEKKSLAVPLYSDCIENGKFVALIQINHDNAVLYNFPLVIYTYISPSFCTDARRFLHLASTIYTLVEYTLSNKLQSPLALQQRTFTLKLSS